MTTTRSEELRLPSSDEAEMARQASQALARRLEHANHSVVISDGTADETLTLPTSATRLLLRILSEMADGNAVTLMPVHAELTTQEAADLLNVSRPYLVNLLETREIPFHRVGKHRRVLASNLLQYKERRDRESEAALEELTAIAVENDMGY